MMFRIFSVVLFSAAFLLASCNQPSKPQSPVSSEQLKEILIWANIAAIQEEEEHINDFIDRRGWEMQSTGSGLRYLIYQQGDGEKASEGKVVRINYTLRSIAGDIIYTSDECGPMEFLIGKYTQLYKKIIC